VAAGPGEGDTRGGVGLEEGRIGALEHNLPSALAGARTELDNPVGPLHRAGLVLNYQDGVAPPAQILQYAHEPLHISRVEPDGRLVQNVQRVHQVAAQTGGQPDPLHLAAG
jgi:hypothetical protein